MYRRIVTISKNNFTVLLQKQQAATSTKNTTIATSSRFYYSSSLPIYTNNNSSNNNENNSNNNIVKTTKAIETTTVLEDVAIMDVDVIDTITGSSTTTTTTTTKTTTIAIPIPLDDATILQKKEENFVKVNCILHNNSKSVFPWRCESTVLERLQEGTDEYNNDILNLHYNNNNDTFSNKRIRQEAEFAWTYLNLPMYEIFLDNCGQSFRQNLANNVAYIFPIAVQSLLTNIYPTTDGSSTTDSTESDDNNEDTVAVDFTYNINNDTSVANTDANTDTTTQSTTNAKSKKSSTSTSNTMFHSDLQKLYTSAYESMKRSNIYNNSNIQIQLQIQPISASLYSIYCIPGMTRSLAEKYPELVQEYYQLFQKDSQNNQNDTVSSSDFAYMNNIQSKYNKTMDFYDKLFEINNNESNNENFDSVISSTIEIQVLIKCTEYFHITCNNTDRTCTTNDTNDINETSNDSTITIQGSNVIQNDIVHLVRLETTSRIPNKVANTMYDIITQPAIYDNWQITDIDDLVIVTKSKTTNTNTTTTTKI